MSQLIDLAVTPVIPLAAAPLPKPPEQQPTWPVWPGMSADEHLHRAVVVAAILRRTSQLDLPPICTWEQYSHISLAPQAIKRTGTAGLRGHIKGQMLLPGAAPEQIRAGIQAWADALLGEVDETPHHDYVTISAWVIVSGALVSVWGHLSPDGTCPACDAPAVGELVLRHEAHCPLLAPLGGAK